MDTPFARYSPLNYTVTLKLGWGHSIKVIVALFDRAHTTLYSSSIVTICLYLVPFPRFSRILVENWHATPVVFGAPVRGEAVRFTQQPLVTKN